MTIVIKIPQEIEDYEEKLIGGLSGRKLLSGGIAIFVAIFSYYFVSKLVGQNLASWVVLILATPIVSYGFIKPDGHDFEKFIKIIYDYKFSAKIRVLDSTIDERNSDEINGDKKTDRKNIKRKKKQKRKINEPEYVADRKDIKKFRKRILTEIKKPGTQFETVPKETEKEA